MRRLALRDKEGLGLLGPVSHIWIRRARARDRAAAIDVLSAPWLIALLVAAGVVLRARQYFADRSLWLDEAYLALNIIGHGPRDLLGVLDYNQGAPPGFMLVEGTLSAISRDELWLRLPAFAAGIATLCLIVPVARRCCSWPARALACA